MLHALYEQNLFFYRRSNQKTSVYLYVLPGSYTSIRSCRERCVFGHMLDHLSVWKTTLLELLNKFILCYISLFPVSLPPCMAPSTHTPVLLLTWNASCSCWFVVRDWRRDDRRRWLLLTRMQHVLAIFIFLVSSSPNHDLFPSFPNGKVNA